MSKEDPAFLQSMFKALEKPLGKADKRQEVYTKLREAVGMKNAESVREFDPENPDNRSLVRLIDVEGPEGDNNDENSPDEDNLKGGDRTVGKEQEEGDGLPTKKQKVAEGRTGGAEAKTYAEAEAEEEEEKEKEAEEEEEEEEEEDEEEGEEEEEEDDDTATGGGGRTEGEPA
uniref:Uncharacterized protein n=1 Tax=Chromera velia CCMP2878 TaxID=1169474 RepID=A0A0G4G5Y3_9ALVE|eukprot:Cvel_20376.t1-p1 / transcript=Cvel_20376.t1 / gene=Cvel_20376 / organism=Chromera_velia_CCMP2878 / gene_product=hypothetical protein / transcript_product=hypothetical protein / location=Cvel_scaffold1823:24540-30273(-) / protein_length=172 / sequence_SO=supercontig / SO=protein_coding / is_pseudo=false